MKLVTTIINYPNLAGVLRLRALEAAGHVELFRDDRVIVGRASDGVEVHLGHLDDDDAGLFSYLETHPTPADW